MIARNLACLAMLGLALACRHEARCGKCGMKVDSASPWVGYVTIDGAEVPFDTPHCALETWRGAAARVKDARFREYYTRELTPVGELRFVGGSDVVGPMGSDLVPVAIEKAPRFARDHNGAPPRSAEEMVRDGLP
jgi:copper chaperone NosL